MNRRLELVMDKYDMWDDKSGEVIFVDFIDKKRLTNAPKKLSCYERSVIERRIDEIVSLMDACDPFKDVDVLDNLASELNYLDLAMQRCQLEEENRQRLAELEGIRPKGMKPKIVA